MDRKKIKLFIVVSEDWSFWSHRLSLARSALKNGYDVTLITKINDLGEKIKEENINVVNVNFARSSTSPLSDLLNIFKLASIFIKEKPDIIHNVALKTILISLIAGLFYNKAIEVNAFTGLGYVFSSSQKRAKRIRTFIKPVFKFLMSRERIWTVFQNPDDMGVFQTNNLISAERSALIRGSGVDTNEFTQTKDSNDVPVVMLASRMLWDKGVGEFVEAAKLAQKENLKAKFVLVGDTDEENPMAIPVSILEKWSSEGFVEWKGHSGTMPKTLSSSSIVCLPSYREGLPKVLLEAASIGRPLVATDVPGCREIVQDGKNGILVKLKDVDSLYKAIKTLVLNAELRVQMGQKGRQLVENELSTDIINRQTLELYHLALKEEGMPAQ